MDSLDPGELVEGYQIGRAHRLAEWSFRREQKDFARLCRTLKHKRWRTAVLAEDGDRAQTLRAQQKRQKDRAKAAEHEAHRKAAKVTKCPACDASWCLLPGMHGRSLKWCSPDCKKIDKRRRLNERYRRRAKGREATCGLCRERGHNRRTCPEAG